MTTNRAEMNAATQADIVRMQELMVSINRLISKADVQRGIAVSVLSQMVINLGVSPDLSDDQHRTATQAVLGLVNVMQGGLSELEYSQENFAAAVHDLVAVVSSGSRPLMIPALAAVLVAATANGRRDHRAEADAQAAIREALVRLDSTLSASTTGEN